MPPPVDLNLVPAFVALIEERSTTRAAARLGLAQSTVSGTLARLRGMLGDPLLVRDGNALVPTARALDLLAATRPHLDGLTAALSAAQPFDPTTATRIFRLGCTDAVAMALLPGVMATLRRRAPGCRLSLRIGDYRNLPDMLARDEIGLALGYLRDDPRAQTRIKVLRRSDWVVLRDATTAPVTDVAAFCARPHALITPQGDLSGFADAALADLGLTRRVEIGITGFALLRDILRGSDLLATVPDFVARTFDGDPAFATDPCPIALPRVANRMAWRDTAHRDPAEAWFRNRVEAAFA